MPAGVANYDKNHDPENGEFSYGDGGTDPKKGPTSGKSSSGDSGGGKALSGQAANDALNAAYRNKANDLGAMETISLVDYLQNAYDPINSALRNGNARENSATIQGLDSAINKFSTPADITVYRGGSGKDDFAKVNSIQTFTDKGFVSTSTSKIVAAHFADPSTNTVYEIKIPKGTGAAWIPAYADFMADEDELLLGRGHKFKITGFKPKSLHYGKKVLNVLQMELVS